MEKKSDTSVLEGTITSNKRDIVFQEGKAREEIIKLLSQLLLPAEQAKVYQTLNQFVVAHFIYELSQRYPLISKEIFWLEKEVEVKVKDKYGDVRKYMIKAPVVVGMPFEKSNNGEFSLGVKGIGTTRDDEENLEVSCAIPEITPEARSALAEAVKFSAELTATAYKDDLLSRVLIRDSMNERTISGPLTAQYNLVWAPSVWNARIIEKDPAIFMKYTGRNFFVYGWRIPKEVSLDAMLREFSEDFRLQQ